MRPRVFERTRGSRFVVIDGKWWLLDEHTKQPFVTTGDQWPICYNAADCRAMLDVWENPVELTPK